MDGQVTFAVSVAAVLGAQLMRRRQQRAELPPPSSSPVPLSRAASNESTRSTSSTTSEMIKEMQLYNDCDRVFKELEENGVGPRDPIDMELLSTLDQYHYLGHEPLDVFIRTAGLTERDSVIEIGSGIGGPSRYVAWKSGCLCVAMELQSDLHAIGRILTKRCGGGLDKRVKHVEGDVLTAPVRKEHDALLSILCFLHISDKRTLFDACNAHLRSGGTMFIEDFTRVDGATFSDTDTRLLKEQVFTDAASLATRAEYEAQLRRAGFRDIVVVDMTARWTEFVVTRRKAWNAARARNIRVHGEAVTNQLQQFYDAVVNLFLAGHLGGVRIACKKE